ncbi:HK97 gp10 family phage protein [Streptomyces sp. H51]|uniref:HK97 gp10 family phage protein n=1 Tax=Streptomyces sp. H51 TaxID=3111770 RepID=UPI002D781883|nr:HK97 gp10 family phage protein [Streptomyces sp. H51]
MASRMNPHPNAHPRSGAYTNAADLAALLDERAAQVLPQALAVVRHYTMLLETQVKANASGRPGPNVITGDYRRSWTHEVHVGAGAVSGTVGTNKPQGRRLEYGYIGPDSLGRIFDQPPYPHLGPAVHTIEPAFLQALGQVVDGGLS